MDDKQEKEADDFSSQMIIPNEHVSKLMILFKSEMAIKAFAKEIGIAPGIVVGRVQKEEILPWSHLNKIKVNLIYNTSM